MCWVFSFGMEERQPNSSINRTFESSFLFQWPLITFFCKNPVVWNYRHITHPDSAIGKVSACNAGEPGSIPGSGRSPREETGYPIQYSWALLVAQMVKNLPAMQETRVQFLGQEDPLEKEIAIHSSILAWRIPRTEEVGGLQSTGRKESDMT